MQLARTLLRLADDACQKMRAHGRNCFLIAPAALVFFDVRRDKKNREGNMTIALETTRPSPSHVTVATASLIGTAIEWYDFFLYGTAAALIFNKLFFPTFDPLIGSLLAFATYALGLIAPP